jgi:hypothetical protein
VELLLAAHRDLLRGGAGLDWRRLGLAQGEQPPADWGPLQTWGEINNQTETTFGVLTRAVGWVSEQGITCPRVLSDNGSSYRSAEW